MSLFARRAPVADEKRGVNLNGYLQWIREASATPAGVYVDGESALRHDAVWSCVTRISQDVAMMPVDVVRYVGGTRQSVTPTPQIIAAPSVRVSALDWRYQVIESWLLSGNAWGKVIATTSDGRWPTRIEVLPFPDVSVQPNGRVLVQGMVGEQDIWPLGQVWHVPAYTLPGSWVGLSPIAYHRHKIGAGLAAENFGAEFFGAGGHPTAILSTDMDLGEDGARAVKERFRRASQTREPVVMPRSTEYKQIQINPKDSQFIETMRYTVEAVCRIFGEDPADHGASSGGSSITYANRSDADLARLKRRQFWVVKLQESLTALLPAPQVARLNTSSALMMTPRERHELYGLRLDKRTITVNEVRTLEDEEPFGADFDEPGVPDNSPDMPAEDAADVAADEAADDRSLLTAALVRSIDREPTPVTIINNVPERSTTVNVEPTPVTVVNEVPEQRAEMPPVYVAAPSVTVSPAEVTVNVEPTPVSITNEVDARSEINVPTPSVTVAVPEDAPKRHRVRRDDQGRISEVVEEPS